MNEYTEIQTRKMNIIPIFFTSECVLSMWKLLVNTEVHSTRTRYFLYQLQVGICSGFENKFSIKIHDNIFAREHFLEVLKISNTD